MGCECMDDFFVYLSNSDSRKTFHLYYDCPDLNKDTGYKALLHKDASSRRGFHVCPVCQSRKDRQEAFSLSAPDSSELVPSETSVPDTPDIPTSSTPSRTSSHTSPFRFWLCVCLSFVIGALLVAYFLQKDIQQEYEKQWLGGYGTGKDAGYDLGYTDGSAKVQQSYDSGYRKGRSDGYNSGYDDGYDFGYDEGHEQGYLDGLVVGASYTPYRNSTSSSSYTTQTTQSVTVYVTDTGSKYHRSGCSYLYDSSTPISLSRAKDIGYTPCSRCNPPS